MKQSQKAILLIRDIKICIKVSRRRIVLSTALEDNSR